MRRKEGGGGKKRGREIQLYIPSSLPTQVQDLQKCNAVVLFLPQVCRELLHPPLFGMTSITACCGFHHY